MEVDNIDFVVFSTGPGSFSGIRKACNIAQGISIGLSVPIIGISSFSIIAEQVFRKYNKKKVVVVAVATKKKFFLSKYIRNNNEFWSIKDKILLLNKLDLLHAIELLKKKWVVVGNRVVQVELKKKFFLKKITRSEAQDMFSCAFLKIKNCSYFSFKKDNLLYL